MRTFDYDDYESMIMLAPNMALMQFCCPTCEMHLSITTELPEDIQKRAQAYLAAASSDKTERPSSCLTHKQLLESARPSIVCYASYLDNEAYHMPLHILHPLPAGSTENRAHLEYFKRQLDDVETVDEAIGEIDAGYFQSGES
ncbi:MAG: hypothetical protein LBU48_01275 [Coriobacteriales bacterium]|nr:hypothetical protein [Coriobacteriales bacterium]